MAQATNLLDDLDQRQRQVARQLLGPLCVHAGAGTGKTRAMTYRIAHGIREGVYKPQEVMPLTFTKRAATEMTARLMSLQAGGVRARTFHSAALSQLRYFWPLVIGGSMPQLMASKASLVAHAAHVVGLPANKATIRDLSAEIEWARVQLIPTEDYISHVEFTGRPMPGGITVDKMQRVLTTYRDAKNQRQVIDFEDVLVVTLGMLQERPDVLKQVRSTYKHFIVDEYQDVSPVQQALLDIWLGPDNHNICVVGDAAQTIYSFAGASSRFLTTFEQRYPGAKVIELNKDYRSTTQVVSLANTIIDQGKKHDKELKSAVHLVSAVGDGPKVSYIVAQDDDEEAELIAEKIKELSSSIDYGDMAILYRTNAQGRIFEETLAKAGIGCVIRGGEHYFEREEIRQAMTLIQGVINEFGKKVVRRQNAVDHMTHIAGELGWTREEPSGQGAIKDRWDALQALVQLAEERQEQGLSLVEINDELLERRQTQSALQVNGVTLSSLHAAKGLEWQAVFLAGCSEGLLPIKQAEKPEEINEERRLAYVGVTRAKSVLCVSYARARRRGGRAHRKISRFFEKQAPIQRQYVKKTPRPRHSNGTKEFLITADQVVVERFELLRSWRKQVADGLSVPAYTILTDVALRDIAQIKPTNLKQLSIVRGIGQVKLDQFGSAVLAIIRGEDIGEIADKTVSKMQTYRTPAHSSKH